MDRPRRHARFPGRGRHRQPVRGGPAAARAAAYHQSQGRGKLERHLGTQLLIRTSRRARTDRGGGAGVRDCRAAHPRAVAGSRAGRRGRISGASGELTVTAPTLFGEPARTADRQRVSCRASEDRSAPLPDGRDGERRGGACARGGPDRRAGGQLVDGEACRVDTLHHLCEPGLPGAFGGPRAPEDPTERDGVTYRGFVSSPWRYVRDASHVIAGRARGSRSIRPLRRWWRPRQALGITRALDYQIASELRSGALTPLLEAFEVPALPIHLVFSGQGRLPLKVRALLDWMALGARPGSRPKASGRRRGNRDRPLAARRGDGSLSFYEREPHDLMHCNAAGATATSPQGRIAVDAREARDDQLRYHDTEALRRRTSFCQRPAHAALGARCPRRPEPDAPRCSKASGLGLVRSW